MIVAVVVIAPALSRPTNPVRPGQPAPVLAGTTLDGEAFSLADLQGRPVIVNFWGPSCVPCRDEFPLFVAKLQEHAPDDLAIVGVLMFDPAGPARDFVADHAATWPTVDDPDGAIRATYRVLARPQTFFIDRDGILRGIQVGQLSDAGFERFYALIAGAATTSR
ncbi:MAG: TlpA family protein disulfide reductase [Chloroflexi bacterium]|nr:TlpA family protein disulfide reductase [Chloroflexota bacterium]